MTNTYRTAQVARMVGVHPNTVRLYEKLGLIPTPMRQENGYRVFTEFHIAVFRFARLAFQIEVLQNGLRKTVIRAVKKTALGEFDEAFQLLQDYEDQVKRERAHAEEAIAIVKETLAAADSQAGHKLKRKEAAGQVQISVDTLRNWEMNGLLTVKRGENGYRVYSHEDIKRLKVIRALRCANYSLEAILRLLNAVSINPETNLSEVLNTPGPDDEIVSVCDRLIVSLKKAEENAGILQAMLIKIKNSVS